MRPAVAVHPLGGLRLVVDGRLPYEHYHALSLTAHASRCCGGGAVSSHAKSREVSRGNDRGVESVKLDSFTAMFGLMMSYNDNRKLAEWRCLLSLTLGEQKLQEQGNVIRVEGRKVCASA